MFIYLTGENFSKTIGDVIATMKDYVDREGKDNMQQHASAMVQVRALMRQERLEEALEMFNRLPAVMKEQKAFRLLKLNILAKVNMELYTQEILKFEKDFAGDASAQLVLIDVYFSTREFEKLLVVLDRIDTALGGDPMLHYFRALTCNQMGEREKAIHHLEILQKEVPQFGDGQLELMAYYIEADEPDRARKLMAAYRNNSRFDQAKLNNIRMLYPQFVEQ
jgi:tetratricopeptide (TPR) repeat protein